MWVLLWEPHDIGPVTWCRIHMINSWRLSTFSLIVDISISHLWICNSNQRFDKITRVPFSSAIPIPILMGMCIYFINFAFWFQRRILYFSIRMYFFVLKSEYIPPLVFHYPHSRIVTWILFYMHVNKSATVQIDYFSISIKPPF